MKDNVTKLIPEEHNLNFSSEDDFNNFIEGIMTEQLHDEVDAYWGMIEDFLTFHNNRNIKRTSLPVKGWYKSKGSKWHLKKMSYQKFIDEIVLFFDNPKKKYEMGGRNIVSMIHYTPNPYNSELISYIFYNGVPTSFLRMEVYQLYMFLYNNPRINTVVEDTLSYIDYVTDNLISHLYRQLREFEATNEHHREVIDDVKKTYLLRYNEFKGAITSILDSAENPPVYVVNDLLVANCNGGEIRHKSLIKCFDMCWVLYGNDILHPLLSIDGYIYSITEYDIDEYVFQYLDMLNEEVGDVSCLN